MRWRKNCPSNTRRKTHWKSSSALQQPHHLISSVFPSCRIDALTDKLSIQHSQKTPTGSLHQPFINRRLLVMIILLTEPQVVTLLSFQVTNISCSFLVIWVIAARIGVALAFLRHHTGRPWIGEMLEKDFNRLALTLQGICVVAYCELIHVLNAQSWVLECSLPEPQVAWKKYDV
jgi:hypothetical protein